MWWKGQEAEREKTLQKWGYRWRKGSEDKKLVVELFWTGEERCQSRSLNLERNVCSELTMRIWNTGTMIRHILTREHHCNKQILVFIHYCLWVFQAGIIEQQRTNQRTFFLFNTNVCSVFLQKHTVNPGLFSTQPNSYWTQIFFCHYYKFWPVIKPWYPFKLFNSSLEWSNWTSSKRGIQLGRGGEQSGRVVAAAHSHIAITRVLCLLTRQFLIQKGCLETK